MPITGKFSVSRWTRYVVHETTAVTARCTTRTRRGLVYTLRCSKTGRNGCYYAENVRGHNVDDSTVAGGGVGGRGHNDVMTQNRVRCFYSFK